MLSSPMVQLRPMPLRSLLRLRNAVVSIPTIRYTSLAQCHIHALHLTTLQITVQKLSLPDVAKSVSVEPVNSDDSEILVPKETPPPSLTKAGAVCWLPRGPNFESGSCSCAGPSAAPVGAHHPHPRPRQFVLLRCISEASQSGAVSTDPAAGPVWLGRETEFVVHTRTRMRREFCVKI
jgi:hypothetical protein